MFAVLPVVLGGCIFDQDGTAVDLDVVYVEAQVDAPRDATVDRPDSTRDSTNDAPDARVDPECAAAGSSTVCRYGASGDAAVVGQTGACINRQFSRARYCFADAPCSSASGLCTTTSCTPCGADSDCAGACTVLFTGGKAQLCCVGASSNGVGTFNTGCSRGDNCKSGLCTDAGFCYTPCKSNGDCSGGNCGATVVTIGGGKYTQLGCRPGVVADATVDSSVDAPTPDTTADGPVPDTTIDSPVPDTTVDSPTSDASVDASVDSSVDASVDSSADAGAG